MYEGSVRLKDPEMRYSPFVEKLMVELDVRVIVVFDGDTFPNKGTGAMEVCERTMSFDN